MGEAENSDAIARARGFDVYVLACDDGACPPRFYLHREADVPLWWLPLSSGELPSSEQLRFGRRVVSAGLLWGAGTAIDLAGLLEEFSGSHYAVSPGSVRLEVQRQLVAWGRATRRKAAPRG